MHPSIGPCASPYVRPSAGHPSVRLSLRPTDRTSVRLSICASVRRSSPTYRVDFFCTEYLKNVCVRVCVCVCRCACVCMCVCTVPASPPLHPTQPSQLCDPDPFLMLQGKEMRAGHFLGAAVFIFFLKGPRPTEACWCLLCSCRECAGQKAVKSGRRGAQGRVRAPEILLGCCQAGTSRIMHTQDGLPGPLGGLPGTE